MEANIGGTQEKVIIYYIAGVFDLQFFPSLCSLTQVFCFSPHIVFDIRWWDCVALPIDVKSSDEAAFRMQIRELAFTVIPSCLDRFRYFSCF